MVQRAISPLRGSKIFSLFLYYKHTTPDRAKNFQQCIILEKHILFFCIEQKIILFYLFCPELDLLIDFRKQFFPANITWELP